MSRETSQTVIHICVIAAILSGLFSIVHLSWTECGRLGAVLAAGVVLVYRYRRAVVTNGDLTAAPLLLALMLAFVTTQFDPATSSLHYRVPQARMNAVFVISSILAFVAGTVSFVAYRDRLTWRSLTTLDRVVLGVVIAVSMLSLVSRKVVGVGVGRDEYLSVIKVLSYGAWWIAITRTYGAPWLPSPSLLLKRWIAPSAAVVVVFAPTIIYGGYRTLSIMSFLGQGQEAYQIEAWGEAKQYYEAADRLNETVDYGPARDRYLNDLAVIQFRLGNDREGQSLVGRMRAATMDVTDAERKAGDTYLAAERWAEATRSYGRVLERGPNRDVQDRIGLAYLRMGDSRNFLELANRYAYLPVIDAQTFDELIFLGNVQFYRWQYGSALEFYRRAADVQPDDAYAEYKVGRALFEQGQIDQAMHQYRRAIELEPDFADAHYRIGLCLESKGDKAAALAKYEEAVMLLPNHLDGMLALERLSGGSGEERAREKGRK